MAGVASSLVPENRLPHLRADSGSRFLNYRTSHCFTGDSGKYLPDINEEKNNNESKDGRAQERPLHRVLRLLALLVPTHDGSEARNRRLFSSKPGKPEDKGY